jgi:general secretion pathway protein M
MIRWFYAKPPRERLALLAGGASLLILLIYLLVWTPFISKLERKQAQLEGQRATLAWLQSAVSEVAQLRAAQPANASVKSNESLFTLVDRTATQNRLRKQIDQIKPQGDNRVQVWMENAAFDAMLRWLGLLQQQYRIQVVSMNIDSKDKPGRINARISLERSAP